jgi:hypothetical protein
MRRARGENGFWAGILHLDSDSGHNFFLLSPAPNSVNILPIGCVNPMLKLDYICTDAEKREAQLHWYLFDAINRDAQ